MLLIKKTLNLFLFFLLFLFLLILFLSNFRPREFSDYIFYLESIPSRERFGELLDKRIAHDPEITQSYGITKDWIMVTDSDLACQRLVDDDYDAYFLSSKKATKLLEEYPDLKQVGENVIYKNYTFLVANDYIILGQNRSILSDFFLIIRNYIKGNLGFTKDRTYKIAALINDSSKFSIYLIIFSSLVIVFMSTALSFMLASKKNPILKKIISYLLELISSIPGFLIAFALLFIFCFNSDAPNWFKFYGGSARYFTMGELSFSWELLKYFSLPVITLSFSNGTISVLTKILVEKLQEIRKSENYKFFIANGMSSFYLNYKISTKHCLPIILNFISMKIPLIVGSSVIIEKIFDINGVGNLAYSYFSRLDIGMIIVIFSVIYLFTILFDLVLSSLNFYLQPILWKKHK